MAWNEILSSTRIVASFCLISSSHLHKKYKKTVPFIYMNVKRGRGGGGGARSSSDQFMGWSLDVLDRSYFSDCVLARLPPDQNV